MDNQVLDVRVVPEVLTDNSVSYNVHAHIYGEFVKFDCLDEKHATKLAELINDCSDISVK